MSRHAPEILAELREGTDERQLRSVEQQLGVRFPASVRECYRIHDGASGHALLDYWEFLSLDQMLAAWKTLKQYYDEGVFRESGGSGFERLEGEASSRGPIRRQWWNPKWIPFTNCDGHHLCMDFDPAKGGKVTQVLMFDRALGWRELLARSFKEWWQNFASDLEHGTVVLNSEGVLVKK